MPGVRKSEMVSGTYVFESFPTALSEKFKPYKDKEAQNGDREVTETGGIRCKNTDYLKPLKRIQRTKIFKGGYLSSDLPPVVGRLHAEIQTDLYLEELVDKIELIDKCIQTDNFLNRPSSPFFIPSKSGTDVDTQVYEGDVFFFDTEVKPIVEVLITKTMEQAMLEVMEEEELANIRCEINHQGEIRAAYLNEIMRREIQNKRYRDEYERRLQDAKDLAKLRLETGQKIITNLFTKKLLEPLMPFSFENLYVNGYFRDPVELDLQTFFMGHLLSESINRTNSTHRAYITIDGLIREAVDRHRNEYSNL